MVRSFALAAAVAVGAMAAMIDLPATAVAAAPGCSASTSTAWQPVRGRAYRLEAFASGPTCALAVVTLVVRAPDGRALWTDAAPAEHLMTFGEVKTRAQMAQALGEWLMQAHTFRSTAELPEWMRGQDTPMSGEFQFLPEAGIDRDTYEETRAAKLPVFCYVQGMESMSCIVLSKDGQMNKIGVQTFPG
jgi:hypothetical protein